MRVAIRLLVLLLGLALLTPTGTAVADPVGPPLTEDPAALAAATSCDPTAQLQAAPEVVLLVHGTATTVKESWDWGYVRALHADGYALCTVTLPDFGLGSVTRAAEYVVAAARTAIELSGKRISIIGHSQGGQLAAWVTRFWPDVAAGVQDVVALASPFNGTALGNTLCVLKRCSALAWQSRRGSKTVAALRNAPVPAGVDTTSIATRYDQIVFPQPAASKLPGAKDILLQKVCPNDPVEHNLILGDPLGYALAVDAITHAGPADPARIPKSTCQQLLIPHGDPAGAAAGLSSIVRFFTGILDPRRFVSAEPPLPAYAQ